MEEEEEGGEQLRTQRKLPSDLCMRIVTMCPVATTVQWGREDRFRDGTETTESLQAEEKGWSLASHQIQKLIHS